MTDASFAELSAQKMHDGLIMPHQGRMTVRDCDESGHATYPQSTTLQNCLFVGGVANERGNKK